MKVLYKNILSLGIVKLLQYLIPLIAYPYIIYIVGLEKFGLVTVALSFCVFFGSIIQYGFLTTAPRDISKNIDNVSLVYNRITSTKIFLISGRKFSTKCVMKLSSRCRSNLLSIFPYRYAPSCWAHAAFQFWHHDRLGETDDETFSLYCTLTKCR